MIIEYYKKAKKLQKNLDINCIKSQKDSIAEECSFPENKKKKEGINKLFMCKCDQFENENCVVIDSDYPDVSMFSDIRKEYFYAALQEGQEIACKKFLSRNKH